MLLSRVLRLGSSAVCLLGVRFFFFARGGEDWIRLVAGFRYRLVCNSLVNAPLRQGCDTIAAQYENHQKENLAMLEPAASLKALFSGAGNACGTMWGVGHLPDCMPQVAAWHLVSKGFGAIAVESMARGIHVDLGLSQRRMLCKICLGKEPR